MQIAPNGAVMRMDSTATVRTICPQGSPMESGSAPIAACTVAFGAYAAMQKIRSFQFKSVNRNFFQRLFCRIISNYSRIRCSQTFSCRLFFLSKHNS